MKVSSRQILLLSSTIIAILSATICTTTAFIPSYNTRSSLAIIKPSTLKETILQQESGERSSSYEGRGGRGEYGRGRGRGGPGGRGGRGTNILL